MAKDILLNENNELLIVNGDFVVGEADEQNIRLNLVSHKGDWRQHPEAGFGIDRFIKSSEADTNRFKAELQQALRQDGYRLKSLDIDEGFEDFNLEFEKL
ncbi:hypothetical protein [Algivirga pacifica]|uniref:Oxidase n=1 Tax=Algivirga pacifica TaxID=1162670 RepID=A0ABP9D3T1_9BACT